MMGRRLRSLLLLSLGCAFLAASSPTPPRNAETALNRIQRAVARIDAEAKTPEGEARVLARLSAQLGVSQDSLQAQHDAWGLGYGEIAMAYGFARASRNGKTAADVVAMRSTGTGWLDIARSLGVKVDAVANRMKRHVGPKSNR
jgi:DNA-directed RNA polymerase specialized sigma24 family protein